MSASLVGSEMCIRDRRNEGLRLSLIQHRREPFGLLGVLGSYPLELDVSCLLYTSDAADDM
eukprot:5639977-Alexandrium_andersonii.AAC.1